jgi:hypothetical protein
MKARLGLASISLFCWLVMFLAGTDVWHAAGSPDFWSLPGPPYFDMRVFAYAFYTQLFVLVGQFAVSARR